MRRLVPILAVAFVLAACGSDDTSTEDTTETSSRTPMSEERAADAMCPEGDGEIVERDPDFDGEGLTITLVAHDSFVVSDGILETFTDETGIAVDVLTQGDTGSLVASSLLTAGDDPVGDVIFGVDNTFACRAVNGGVFRPYFSRALASVNESTLTDPAGFLTPIDVGDVCINYSTVDLDPPPTSLDDLLSTELADQFVTQNPETSSPGFAFLLATIEEYGNDWEGFWADLRDNGLLVTNGWSEAYYSEFVGGEGDHTIVTSYASSPTAEVVFAEEPIDVPSTAALLEGCYRQFEYAGIAAGTDEPQAAAMLVDFLLSETYQSDIALNQFVYPVRSGIDLPDAFERFGALADDPAMLDPAEVEQNRDDWTARWVEIVLG